MSNRALDKIIENLTADKSLKPLRFDAFLNEFPNTGASILRNIYQLFHDMVLFYAREMKEAIPFDHEALGLQNYNIERIFIQYTEKPFFADRLFANRLVQLAKSYRAGPIRNKIYVFRGPAGSGKSTFLNNMLAKFEEYVRSDSGVLYEVLWRIPFERSVVDHLGGEAREMRHPAAKKAVAAATAAQAKPDDNVFEVPCPNHDNPILLIPKQYRADLLRDLVPESEFKKKLFKHKQYNWVFKDDPCTICTSMFNALLERFSIKQIFEMVYARRFFFNRKQGQGISVFNSGDDREKAIVRTNEVVQNFLNEFFQDSNKVKYLFSGYSSTNQGVRALMDLKARNIQRFADLHGIISDEVHKVSDLEERIKSLFIVLMNPGDLEHIGEEFKKSDQSIDLSLRDRIHEIPVPYVLDYTTEIKIYINTFGDQIKLRFMPHVLDNFARIIVSSRIKRESKALRDWIDDIDEYEKCCDRDLLLLKMNLYAGVVPDWLTKEDRANLKPDVWKSLLAESDAEGHEGFSGRESNQIFDEFYQKYAKKRPISMRHINDFFNDDARGLKGKLPPGFLKHLTDLYDFEVLKEMKDSMYDYNEVEIAKTILNYLVAISLNVGDVVKNPFNNNEELVVTKDFLDIVETHLLEPNASSYSKERYRKEAVDEYASVTLAKEIKCEGKKITETRQYLDMFAAFTRSARSRVLEPYLSNVNFRSAVKEYGSEGFNKYDAKIRQKVELMFNSLHTKYGYSAECAKAICLYVLDNKLVEKFSS